MAPHRDLSIVTPALQDHWWSQLPIREDTKISSHVLQRERMQRSWISLAENHYLIAGLQLRIASQQSLLGLYDFYDFFWNNIFQFRDQLPDDARQEFLAMVVEGNVMAKAFLFRLLALQLQPWHWPLWSPDAHGSSHQVFLKKSNRPCRICHFEGPSLFSE